ncbi:patatin-like phospholipase domain-containing protein 2 isoform X3 [Paramacrobiotus metropolitanus]|uniref:patatin-like phospholipase domain-containing protein 2 isoform X3 n=1 Tax=Paramacrobiotus metropolitanus TaxID=2943436 RepID=UPI002445A66D|nr:patatin-like phospholipase domain-containing protein 2 isoform X3 [Paramacrobiotus metropolitanus]
MLNNLRYLSFVCSDRNFFCFASTKMTRKKITLSFSGCGFMGIYHTGVIRFLRECEDYIEVDKAAGCSAGAMAAVGLLCRPFDRDLLLGIMDVARATRAHPLGPLNPRFSLAKAIRRALTHMLPSNAHEMCRDRLRLSVTRCYDGKGVVLNNFASREELIDAVVCSSFVPFISGIVPPLYRNTYYWDGFLTDNLPIYDERSITVSPFSGESDICPLDASSAFLDIYFSNHHIRLTAKNFFRFSVTLYPSSPEILEKIYWEGYQDARRYIKDIKSPAWPPAYLTGPVHWTVPVPRSPAHLTGPVHWTVPIARSPARFWVIWTFPDRWIVKIVLPITSPRLTAQMKGRISHVIYNDGPLIGNPTRYPKNLAELATNSSVCCT